MIELTKFGPGDPETWGACGDALAREEALEQLHDAIEAECEEIKDDYLYSWPTESDPWYEEHRDAVWNVLGVLDHDELHRALRRGVTQELIHKIGEEFGNRLYAALLAEASKREV